MSQKSLFFMALVVSVVFLGGVTLSGTCFAQPAANNNTKMNQQDMSPGGVNEQQGKTKQYQQDMSTGGQDKTKQYQQDMSTGAQNKTKEYKHDMSPGGQNKTKHDQGEMSPGGVTADQQGESKQDRELTQKIRQAVMKDKDLSMNAHNVKIITIDGVVTLKGPVESEQEKKAIEELAAQIAGEDNIKSEIDIAPK